MKHYKNVTECRVCGSKNMVGVLSLGKQYIGTTFVESNVKHPMAKVKIPLILLKCNECNLVQLKETTNPDLSFRACASSEVIAIPLL